MEIPHRPTGPGREIEIMQGVASSPHIARLLKRHVAPSGDTVVLVYERVDGHSLERGLAQRGSPLTFAE